jgi:hypothetical protein
MEITNNPEQGTGETAVEAIDNIKSLLDSENTTTEIVDAEDDSVEESNTEYADSEIDVDQPEGESEEVDGEVSEEGEAEETEPVISNTFKDEELVTIDGEQISFGELKKQRMLHADYTRKRQQETAELKQHMVRYQTQQVEMADMRVAVGNDINQMKLRLAVAVGDTLNPPSEQLYMEDPYTYGLQKMEFDRKTAAVQELFQAEQLLAQQNARWAEEQHKLKQATALEEFSTKYVEFADKQKAPALLGELGVFMMDLGFSREEIEGIADSRIMDTVYRLYKAEIVSKQVPTVVKQLEKRAKLAMPGAATTKAPSKSAVEVNMRKYRETGSSEFSTAAIRDLLDSE